jgi:hypothetical protein
VGDEVKLDAQLGAAGLHQQVYDNGVEPLGTETGQDPERGDASPVGPIRRVVRRAVVVSVVLSTCTALVAWAALLVYGGIWVVHQLPLV